MTTVAHAPLRAHETPACTVDQGPMCAAFLDAMEAAVARARHAFQGQVPGERHGKDGCAADLRLGCGPVAWEVLHAWAQAVHDAICPSCGAFAVAAARALHDTVNVKLGKPVHYPEALRRVAAAMGEAAQAATLPPPLAQRRPPSQKPVCTPAQREKLERCVAEVKARNVAQGCRPEGTGSRRCPVPWAVCQESIGCRPGRRAERRAA